MTQVLSDCRVNISKQLRSLDAGSYWIYCGTIVDFWWTVSCTSVLRKEWNNDKLLKIISKPTRYIEAKRTVQAYNVKSV